MHKCYYCESEFEEYVELARHINSTHAQKHNKWAANFVLKKVLFKEQDKNDNRMPLTEEEKEAKRSTQRELSGREHTVFCRCPRCNQTFQEKIPVEFLTSNTAWKSHNGEPMVHCDNCRR